MQDVPFSGGSLCQEAGALRLKMPPFGREAKLYIISQSLLAASYLGVHNLLKTLFVLRLGFGPEYVGLYNALGAMTYSLMGIPNGWLGRRFGPRRILLVGTSIVVVGLCLIPLTESMPTPFYAVYPIAIHILITFGWSMANVNQIPALMAVARPETKTDVYFWNQGVRGMGTFTGTLVGGLLPALFGGLIGQSLDRPMPYALAQTSGVLLTVGALVPLLFIRPAERATVAEAETEQKGGLKFPVLPVALLVAYVLLRHGGWATSQAFFPAYMDEVLFIPTATIGLIASAGQLVGIVVSFMTPRLLRRHGHGSLLIRTTIGVAVSLGLMAILPHWFPASVGRIAIYVLSAIWLPTIQLFEMEMVAPEWRPLAYGALSMAMGGAFGLSSLAGGYIIAGYGYQALFVYGVVLSILATGLIALIVRNRDVILARATRSIVEEQPAAPWVE